jgi:hypothetical protein
MGDSFLSLVIGVTVIGAVMMVLLTTWKISESSVGKDCERLGGFYIGHKVYKCEAVK